MGLEGVHSTAGSNVGW